MRTGRTDRTGRTSRISSRPGREEPVESETVHRRFRAEVREGGDLRLTHDQVVDARVPGERLDGPEAGRLDLAVIADGVLGAGAMPVLVTVGGIVGGDAVDVGELHLPIIRHAPDS
ncbi:MULTISPECIES: hypothetical protein [unclassified Streptomyces]|uniref:hypothetical protein n=1 Tax=unclassified Streptomyces TaxID=2593676 RepID=UPI0033AAC265